MKYVHKGCLNAWRRTCINPNNITCCDLCHSEYNIVRPNIIFYLDLYFLNQRLQTNISLTLNAYANLKALKSTSYLALKGLSFITMFGYLWGSFATGTMIPSYYLCKEGILGIGISSFIANVISLYNVYAGLIERQVPFRANDILLGRSTNVYDVMLGSRPTSGLDIIMELIKSKNSSPSKVESKKDSKGSNGSNEHTTKYLILSSLGLIALSCSSGVYLYQEFRRVKQRILVNYE
jgi:hypothetical protein